MLCLCTGPLKLTAAVDRIRKKPQALEIIRSDGLTGLHWKTEDRFLDGNILVRTEVFECAGVETKRTDQAPCSSLSIARDTLTKQPMPQSSIRHPTF